MGIIERQGESTSSKHLHPNGEFGFVLEGVVTLTNEDSAKTLEAGSSFYQPPGEWHVVATSNVGARTLVFRIVDPGQPMVVEVE